MSDPSLLGALRRIRFLDGVAEDHLDRIASVARLESYRPGTVLFREGGPPLAHLPGPGGQRGP